MAEYIDFEADASGNSGDEDVIMLNDEQDFIDDETEDNEGPSFYGFVNQTLDPKEVLSECVEEQSLFWRKSRKLLMNLISLRKG